MVHGITKTTDHVVHLLNLARDYKKKVRRCNDLDRYLRVKNQERKARLRECHGTPEGVRIHDEYDADDEKLAAMEDDIVLHQIHDECVRYARMTGFGSSEIEMAAQAGFDASLLPAGTEIDMHKLLEVLRGLTAEIPDCAADLTASASELPVQISAKQSADDPVDTPPDIDAKPESNPPRNEFAELPGGWRVSWNGMTREMDYRRGFNCISQLIAAPSTTIPTMQLVGSDRDERQRADKHSKQPVMDEQYARQIDAEIKSCDEKIRRMENEALDAGADRNCDSATADIDREDFLRELQKVKDDRNRLLNEKRGANSPNGKSRDLNRPGQKAHDNVRKRLSCAYKHLRDKGLNELAEHLEVSIKTDGKGQGYCYEPQVECDWSVTII